MKRSPNFAAVILAAGESLRMGRDKALLPYKGKTFLDATMDALRPITQLVLVVAGANSKDLQPVVWAAGAYVVTNPHPELGQFSSLRIGLQEVLSRGRDAAIVTHVDRPPAAAETMAKLLDAFASAYETDKWAVVPEHGGMHGHPIVIGREMIEAFLRADATSTARDVEHANQKRILYLPVDDPAVVANVNTPEEYADLVEPAP